MTVGAGATVSDPFTFTLPPGSAPGVRTISTGWWLSCGTSAFATLSATFEVQPDAPGITSPASGARLATSTPTVTGTAVAGAAVTVRIGTTSYTPVTAAGDGSWTFTAPALADGPWTVTASQAVAGVSSDWAPPIAFETDATPPRCPSSAPSPARRRRNPVVVVVTAPGATSVNVYRNGSSYSTTPASVSGSSFTFELALPEGSSDLQATAGDYLGNDSALSAAGAVVVMVDRTPPSAPVVTSYAAPTNAAPVPVAVTAAAGSIVRLFVDGTERTTMTEGAAGIFAATLDLPLDGTYELSATATDAAGNASEASAIVTLAVDRAEPVAPVIDVVTTPTAAKPVPILVTADEAGVTLALWLDGAATASAGPLAGTTHTFDLDLDTGPHQVWAFATDAAGNESLVSNTVAFDVDLDPPAVPTVEPISSPTSLLPVPVVVTAEAGSTVGCR